MKYLTLGEGYEMTRHGPTSGMHIYVVLSRDCYSGGNLEQLIAESTHAPKF